MWYTVCLYSYYTPPYSANARREEVTLMSLESTLKYCQLPPDAEEKTESEFRDLLDSCRTAYTIPAAAFDSYKVKRGLREPEVSCEKPMASLFSSLLKVAEIKTPSAARYRDRSNPPVFSGR